MGKTRRRGLTLRQCGKETYKNVLEFGEVTSLHGIRHVTDPRAHLVERICWVLFIVVSAVWCGLEITKLYEKWQDSPVITSISQKPTSVTSIPFPAVTICPETKVLRSVIDVEKHFHSLDAYLDGNASIYQNNTDKLIAEAVGMVCNNDQTFPDVQATQENTDKMFEIAPKVEDIFEFCQFHYRNYLCEDLFRPVLTRFGVCFVFNMVNNQDLFTDIVNTNMSTIKRLETNGTSAALNSTYNLEFGYNDDVEKVYEYPRRDTEFLGPNSGLEVILKLKVGESQDFCSFSNAENFRVVIHNSVDFPSPMGNYFHISPNSQAMVAIRPTLIQTDDSLKPPKYNPQLRGCVYPEEQPVFALKALTKENSLLDLLHREIAQNCNCSIFFMPVKVNGTTLNLCSRDLQQCFDDDNNSVLNDLSAAQLPSCHELRYRYHISNANYKYNAAQKGKNHYTKLIVFYEEGTFYAWKKSELYGTTDFIANCGGLLGLFTGFSILSALEIFYFASLRFACRLRERESTPQEQFSIKPFGRYVETGSD